MWRSKRYTAISLCIWVATVAAALSAPAIASSSAVASLTASTDFDAAVHSRDGKLTMVEFTADWCAPCRKVAPIIAAMPYTEAAGTSYTEVSAAEANRLIAEKNPVILDVRTPREYRSGHISGAVLIPVQQLADRIAEITQHRHRDVFIYCRSGNRSTVAAEILHKAGFKSVYNLRHGIVEWRAAGYKVITPG